MCEQEVDGVLAQIPRRRAITARLAAGESRNRLVGADEIGLLLVAALLRGWNMRPAVVRNLVAVRGHRLARRRMALDGEAGHEPGGADAARFQQRQNPARADQAELAARQRGRRGHAARDEPGLRVEIEGQADDVARHLEPRSVDTSAIAIA